ncbi:MAG: hypothetical protein WCK21_05370, partial [Actinomycetota bacterium]
DDRLLTEILSQPFGVTRSRRHRWWVTGGAVVAVVGLAAYAFLRTDAAHDPTTVSCYSDASAHPADQYALGAEADPVAACRQVWAAGHFALGEAAALTPCVTKSGIVAVVPGDQQVCADLGMSLWNRAYIDADQSVVVAQDELTQTLGLTCYPADGATRIAHDVLSRHGLAGWAVVSNDNWSPEFPCTGAGIDPSNKTITLGARPRTPRDLEPKGKP